MINPQRLLLITLLVAVNISTTHGVPHASPDLGKGFVHPPFSARPWVYWFWLNGNITSNGITADLESMQRVGIGGVLIMEVDQGAPKGPAAFGGVEWRDLFKHVCAEAHRLGLEVNMNNDAGWCGSGGPWITPDLAMQKLTWSETNVTGPLHLEAKLAQPTTVLNYYRDIAVFAFPTPVQDTRIENINAKAAFVPERVRPSSNFPHLPEEATIKFSEIKNVTGELHKDGQFTFEVPQGRWTILRLGHTLTGKDNHPAPQPGRGLESDKLSKAATDAMFAGLMGKLIVDSKHLAGGTLVATHIDSWETGSQNWTPRFREEFKRLRRYDPLLYLPIVTGRVIDSLEISERFLWDLRQTVSDLLIQNYAGRFRELAHKHGMRLSIEAYDGAPCDEMTYAGQADEPMSEFWSWGHNAAYSCTEMASAAHVYGKSILGAEAFTATDGEKWLHHPASIKALGDWAFCEGINRFVFHRYALQPWENMQPGMSMGPWGLHYERTQTWWEQSTAWHEYLARCQFLLQQGLFVADICYLQPEGSPQRFLLSMPGSPNTPERPKHNFDGCTPEALLTRMKVKDGKLVLPDGMSYRLLVLPQVNTMTPQLLGKIKDLVKAGATVVGSRPVKSPSLSGYPNCDVELQKLADELWGKRELTARIIEHQFGKGRVIFGGELERKPAIEDKNQLAHAKWIWFPEGNPAVAAPPEKRYFRRLVSLPTNSMMGSAQIAVTADNTFELWINGKRVGGGEDFHQVYKFDAANFFKPGPNLIAIAAENQSDKPNPAGLIATCWIQFKDSRAFELNTDQQWEVAKTAGQLWNSEAGADDRWQSAMELGPAVMAPWGTPGRSNSPLYEFPDFDAIARLLARMHVEPDFEAGAQLRYIHKQIGDTDIYFVANPGTNWLGASCAFRVSGKEPEIWSPMNGSVKRQPAFQHTNGRTFVPLWFEPVGSVFVLFRKPSDSIPQMPTVSAVKRDGKTVFPERLHVIQGSPPLELFVNPSKQLFAIVSETGRYEIETSSGQTHPFEVKALPEPFELSGPWEVHFQPNRGAPEKIVLDSLTDWSQHPDPGVKYFSGVATYTRKFKAPEALVGGNVYLDLGKVAVMAQVKLNGRELNTLWTSPYRINVGDMLRADENKIEIKVVNLWPNRMIGDEQLPEDSLRNPNGTLKEWPEWLQQSKASPANRVTFTSWRLWKKDSPLQESGLLGPVRFVAAKQLRVL